MCTGQPLRRPARVACVLANLSSMLAMRTISMCGYTAVPEDKHTCYIIYYLKLHISLWHG